MVDRSLVSGRLWSLITDHWSLVRVAAHDSPTVNRKLSSAPVTPGRSGAGGVGAGHRRRTAAKHSRCVARDGLTADGRRSTLVLM